MRPMPVVSPAVAARMTEAQLQATVQQVATLYGWTWHHEVDSRKSRAGFPDLVLVHPRKRICLVRELKTERGRFRPKRLRTRSSGTGCPPSRTRARTRSTAVSGRSSPTW